MKVKLLKDFIDPRTGRVKVVIKSPERLIPYYRDTIVEASEETGRKWIEDGRAKFVPSAPAAPQGGLQGQALPPGQPAPRGANPQPPIRHKP